MKVRQVGVLATAVLCLSLLGGCATQAALGVFQAAQGVIVKAELDRGAALQASQQYGTKIDPARVAELKHGVTTRQEVEQWFGPPMQTALIGDGRRMMLYSYYASKQQQTLQIILNSSNIVQDHEFNTN